MALMALKGAVDPEETDINQSINSNKLLNETTLIWIITNVDMNIYKPKFTLFNNNKRYNNFYP